MPTSFVQPAIPVGDSERHQVFPWEVVHACERPRDLLNLVEGQLSLGMRPQIVTPRGAIGAHEILAEPQLEPDPVSLLSAWNNVRVWRKLLGDVERTCGTAEVVHTHEFSAGMAAVRGGLCPVYDVSVFIDQSSSLTGQDDKSWLGRSFRVAEQFILARAGAVVVHTPAMLAEAERRGTPDGCAFFVPNPVDPAWLVDRSAPADTPIILVPDAKPEQAITLCSAIASLRPHVSEAKLLVLADDELSQSFLALAQDCGVADALEVRRKCEFQASLARAEIVMVHGGSHPEQLANPTLLRAMASGAAVLAADVPPNRNISSDGEGVLWLSPELAASEILRRLRELFSSTSLRRRLGTEARNFVERTRTPVIVARQYDEIYRVVARKRRERNVPPMASIKLQPAFGNL